MNRRSYDHRAAVLSAALVVAVATALAACGGDDAGDEEGAAAGGGTLRIDAPGPSYAIDPGTGFSDVIEATQLTLLGLPSITQPGAPVPEAARLPRVSRDGLTYTFTVRDGFRFSDGRPVTAANFATAFNRILQPELEAYAGRWLADVVGADAVMEGRAPTASGIVARGNTLTIRLRRPVPDLPAKLALPSFGAVPVGFPVVRGGVTRAPLHSAGPYYVASLAPGKRAVLARNPYWRSSLLPRRPGNVDRIVISFNVDPRAQVARVEGNLSDLARTPDPSRWRELVTSGGIDERRAFLGPRPELYWLVFNHDRPLFGGNARLRRAVNLALDRRHLVRQAMYLLGTPTDQILVPGLPGFRDQDIYPVDGPRLAEARALARGALRGGKAVLWVARGDDEPFAEVIKYDLGRIGLTVELERLSLDVLLNRLQRPNQPWDMMLLLWIGDYPDPANFLDEALRWFPGAFDDATYERKLAQASSLTGEARYDAFADLDLEVMRDQAPVAPIMSLKAFALVSESVGCVEPAWDGFARWDAICKR